MSEKTELPYQHFDTSRWHACDGGAVGCWTVEVVCVVTEIVIIAVCKKLVKTQINTILAHEIVKAISQEPLAQLTWSLLQPF